MNTLDRILAHKQKEVEYRKAQTAVKTLEKSALFERTPFSLENRLRYGRTGIIAEFKRKSPSKGIINDQSPVTQVTQGYQQAGAAGVSILTDEEFFGGTLADLETARPHLHIPILRKDFVIGEYQIIEAKAVGADVVLLIAAALPVKTLHNLATLARSLGLDVLLEVHNLTELHQYLHKDTNLIGVNNRNLKNFEVSLQVSKELATEIPDDFIKISESGISTIADITQLQSYGYKGFLIGENFMKTSDPSQAIETFVKDLLANN